VDTWHDHHSCLSIAGVFEDPFQDPRSFTSFVVKYLVLEFKQNVLPLSITVYMRKVFFFFFLTSCDCSERILFRNSLNLNRLFHENEDFSWRSQIWVEIKLPSWGGPTAERWESSRRFVLYRKYVRPFQIVPVDFFFVTRLIHTSRPRANRRVSFEKPADRKFSTVTLFSPENDGGKRSSVNVFRHVFLLWLAVDLMRTDGEGAENVTRGRRRGQRRKV